MGPDLSNNFKYRFFLPAVSGLFIGISTLYMIYWLAFISFIPILFSFYRTKKVFIASVITSIFYSIVMEHWVFNAVYQYTGGKFWLCLLSYLAALLIMGFKLFVILYIFSFFKKISSKYHMVIWPFCAVVAEFFLYRLLEGFPWFQYTIGFTQVKSLSFIQLTEFGGLNILSFFVLFVNIVLCRSIIDKSSKLLIYAVLIIISIYGYGLLRIYLTDSQNHTKIKLALVNDNSGYDLRWKKEKVNEYAKRLINLSGSIKDKGQVLNIWNEGVIPWTYKKDDDLLNALLEKSPSRAPFIIGTSTQEGKDFYNSIYLLDNYGRVCGRYDKNNLLKGLEIPFFSIKLPFFEKSPFKTPEKKHRDILNLDNLKIGVLICNEGITGKVLNSFKGVKYNFIILAANDNWFENTCLIEHHFYFNRLRAVQARKDMIINTNLGISGHISASGRIMSQVNTNKPFVKYYDINVSGEG